ncbi:hypothetical protein F5X98DRAFT_350480 [Xylaria grammica]|nr:hypothetical protein F5X98DRAFT_350480 [Xylaria grammica]
MLTVFFFFYTCFPLSTTALHSCHYPGVMCYYHRHSSLRMRKLFRRINCHLHMLLLHHLTASILRTSSRVS